MVDNASTDGSVEYLREHFAQVKVISSDENLGFAKANNKGVEYATGEYLLILNPDTLLQRDTLQTCLAYWETNDSIGLIGVKMYDGSGQYLPESKRGFPTPFVSFCRMAGLGKIFPKSRRFNQYYLGHLDENSNHEVPVLTGAFMFTTRNRYLEVGGFDESYFMYGEDIDLSYKISKAGYSNRYLAETSIIHYKGESTRKASFDYVKRFYEAMLIFSRKHLQSSQTMAYTWAIQSAIYVKAISTFILSWVKRLMPIIVDASILFLSFYAATLFWEKYYFGYDYYQDKLTLINSVIYVAIFIACFLLFGKYHRRLGSYAHVQMGLTAIIILLAVYSLFPSDIRYSRAALLLGGFMGVAVLWIIDWWYDRHNHNRDRANIRTAIVGDTHDKSMVLSMLDKRSSIEYVGWILTDPDSDKENVLGMIDDLIDITRFYRISELIIDQRYVDTTLLLRWMKSLDSEVRFTLYTPTMSSFIGSHSKTSPGQVDTFEVEFNISTPYGRFIKRMIDVLISIYFLVFSIVLWPLSHFSRRYFSSILACLLGSKTWFGYVHTHGQEYLLPDIKPWIAPFMQDQELTSMNRAQCMTLNFIYAREYGWSSDLRAFGKTFYRLPQ